MLPTNKQLSTREFEVCQGKLQPWCLHSIQQRPRNGVQLVCSANLCPSIEYIVSSCFVHRISSCEVRLGQTAPWTLQPKTASVTHFTEALGNKYYEHLGVQQVHRHILQALLALTCNANWMVGSPLHMQQELSCAPNSDLCSCCSAQDPAPRHHSRLDVST